MAASARRLREARPGRAWNYWLLRLVNLVFVSHTANLLVCFITSQLESDSHCIDLGVLAMGSLLSVVGAKARSPDTRLLFTPLVAPGGDLTLSRTPGFVLFFQCTVAINAF